MDTSKTESARVLFVDQTSALGGAELSLFDIVKQRGARDRVLLFENGDLESMLLDIGADVVVSGGERTKWQMRKDGGITGILGAGSFLRRHVRAVSKAGKDCDVIYANTPKAFIVSALASVLTKKPLIYHLRDIVSSDHFSLVNRLALVNLARLSRATVIANSFATGQAFVHAGGDARRTSVVYNGIDSVDFEDGPDGRETCRHKLLAELGKSASRADKIIGVFGRLARWKGQDVALRALSRLSNAHMLLVGSALFGEDEFVDELNRLVIKLDLEDRVHFLGFRRDVASIMRACDLVVHCSSSPEPFGRVIVEAMLANSPVVAARAGGATEILDDGKTGVLFQPNDPVDLADCISRLFQTTDLSSMTRLARIDATSRFSIEGSVSQINCVIARVRDQKNRKATLAVRPAGKSLTRVLFVDQTAQLGGAELCMKDLVLARRRSGANSNGDRVFLFQSGSLDQLLRSAQIDVRADHLSRMAKSLSKESGPLRKLFGTADVLLLARKVARAASGMEAIVANTPKALVVSSVASLLSRKPLVYHLHDILSSEHFSSSNIWLLVGLANRFATHVIANSNASLAAFRNAGGRTSATVCYNGFESAGFESKAATRSLYAEQLRRELQLDGAAPIVGVFGRLAPWKGQHVAIEAIRSLPNINLILVGDALFGESEYRQKLVDMAAHEGSKARVHFLGFRSDVAELMQAVDVVLHCSTAPEPFGRVIVEAMLSRRPVIAADSGGAREILEHGKTGWLSQPGNSNALANCLKNVLEYPNIEEILDAALKNAVERFALSRIVDEMETVFRGVRGLVA